MDVTLRVPDVCRRVVEGGKKKKKKAVVFAAHPHAATEDGNLRIAVGRLMRSAVRTEVR